MLAMLTAVLAGCGHTNEQMAKMNSESDRLAAELQVADARIAQDQVRYDDMTKEIGRLKEVFRRVGLEGRELGKAKQAPKNGQ